MCSSDLAKGSVVEGAQPGISQTFSDFVPGAKAHLTANGLDGDEDKENASLLTGSLTIEDAATDAEVCSTDRKSVV